MLFNDNFMKYFFIQFFLLLFNLSSFCQNNIIEIKKQLEVEFNNIRKDNIPYSYSYHFDSTNEKYFSLFLKTYINDSTESVRDVAFHLMYRIGINSIDSTLRKKIVEDLIISCMQKRILASKLSSRLLNFKYNDFSDTSKVFLVKMFDNGGYQSKVFLLVCGVAQIDSLIPKIEALAVNFNRNKSGEGWSNSNTWGANLALLRLGQRNFVDKVIAATELELKPTVRVIDLLKDLSYTRDKDCIKLLYKYLKSSEKLSNMNGKEGFPVNQYALEYLAESLENFPVKANDFYYTPNDYKVATEYLEKLFPLR